MFVYLRKIVLSFAAKLVYLALWLVGLVFYWMPFSIKNFVAKLVSKLWFYILRFKVDIVLHNLALVFPRQREESNKEFRNRIEALAQRNLIHMSLLVFEVLERFHWKPSDEGKKYRVVGRENLDFHFNDPTKGFFSLGAHLGNWELVTLVGVFSKVRLTIVTRFLRNPFFDELWVKSRQAFGLELLNESGSGIAIVKAVKRGRGMGFIFDQHTGDPHGIESEFLGLKAWSPKGLAIMNRRLKAPIVPCFILRDAQGCNVVYLEAPIDFCDESIGDASRDIAYHVRRCNDTIGKWILENPEQYLWLHRRFKNIHDYRQALPWDA
ncbi:hypothetical protein GW915_05850 [bacterium]|nr:hypothetical protein [bacterium]